MNQTYKHITREDAEIDAARASFIGSEKHLELLIWQYNDYLEKVLNKIPPGPDYWKVCAKQTLDLYKRLTTSDKTV